MAMNMDSLKKMDDKALRDEIVSMRRELLNLRLNASSGQIKDSSRFGKLRKQVARALTIIHQRGSSVVSEEKNNNSADRA